MSIFTFCFWCLLSIYISNNAQQVRLYDCGFVLFHSLSLEIWNNNTNENASANRMQKIRFLIAFSRKYCNRCLSLAFTALRLQLCGALFPLFFKFFDVSTKRYIFSTRPSAKNRKKKPTKTNLNSRFYTDNVDFGTIETNERHQRQNKKRKHQKNYIDKIVIKTKQKNVVSWVRGYSVHYVSRLNHNWMCGCCVWR